MRECKFTNTSQNISCNDFAARLIMRNFIQSVIRKLLHHLPAQAEQQPFYNTSMV